MVEFIPAVGQLVLSLIFGTVLFLWWRSIAGPPRTPIYWMVTLGLLARLVGGQVLFWISYLELPIARSMQATSVLSAAGSSIPYSAKGFWFFALDGIYYYDRASVAARMGVDAILHIARNEAAVFYIQTLATFLFLFGVSPAGALLMNITAFLGLCAIVLRLAPPHATRSRLWGIAAMSLTPSAILWSLQPLKDIFFLFMVALFVLVCDLWQRLAIRTGAVPGLVWRRAGIALLMGVVLYGISGTRWYFGMALIAASALFFLLLVFRSRSRRWTTAAWSPVILLLMLFAFRAGGGPYIPERILRVITFEPKSAKQAADAQRAVLDTLEHSRKAFDAAGGATAIGAGQSVQKTQPPEAVPDTTPKAATPPPAAQPAPQSSAPAEEQQEAPASPSEAVAPPDAAPATTTAEPPPAAAPAQVPPAVVQAKPAETPPAPLPESPAPVEASPVPPASVQPAPAAATPAPAQPAPAQVTPVQAAPAQVTPAQPEPAVPRQEGVIAPPTEGTARPEPRQQPPPVKKARARTQRTAPASAPAPAPVTTTAAADPVSPPPPITTTTPVPTPPAATTTDAASALSKEEPTVVLPHSKVGRFVSGVAAVVLPKFVAEALGLLELRGGRGLWLFVEIDTLVFDAVLLYACYCVFIAFRTTVRTPSFWLLVAILLLVGVPLVYTVSNFGTLFRHRNMIFLALTLLPLTTAGAPRPDAPAEPPLETATV